MRRSLRTIAKAAVRAMTDAQRSRFVEWLGRNYCLDNGHDDEGTTCGKSLNDCDGWHETKGKK